jgi:hypothetical protein
MITIDCFVSQVQTIAVFALLSTEIRLPIAQGLAHIFVHRQHGSRKT